MTQHRWVALGGAPMTADQAEEWAGLTGIGVAKTSLEVFFSSMICAVCLEQFDEALPLCPGLAEGDENAHVWQAFFTAPATQEEAAAWAIPMATTILVARSRSRSMPPVRGDPREPR